MLMSGMPTIVDSDDDLLVRGDLCNSLDINRLATGEHHLVDMDRVDDEDALISPGGRLFKDTPSIERRIDGARNLGLHMDGSSSENISVDGIDVSLLILLPWQ